MLNTESSGVLFSRKERGFTLCFEIESHTQKWRSTAEAMKTFFHWSLDDLLKILRYILDFVPPYSPSLPTLAKFSVYFALCIVNLFFYPYECHMDLCTESCLSSWPASQPAFLYDKNLNIGHYMQTVLPDLFHASHAYRQHWLLPFYTTFTDLDCALVSQGQHTAKSIRFIFFFVHTFHLIRMKFDVVMKQFKLNILRLFLSNTCLKHLTYSWWLIV